MMHLFRFTMLTFGFALVLAAAPAATAQVDPDDRCTTPTPDIACIDETSDTDAAQLIVWVLATDEGVSIYLTPDGVDRGRNCEGAGEIVDLASSIYAKLPGDVRQRDDLLWANPMLTREVFAHSWAATLGSDRGNPVDVVFADYTDEADSLQSDLYHSPALAALCSG